MKGSERPKRIALLGSTGSIGCSVLDVVARHAGEFEIVGLSARRDVERLAGQCEAHPNALFTVALDADYSTLVETSPELAARGVGCGEDALVTLIEKTKPDLVVNALVGFIGLRPTLAAVELGIPVAVANKETIVTGGSILIDAARAAHTAIIPIDSEHVAISQCLGSEPRDEVERIVMTASGGALRDKPLEALGGVSVDEVLAHPTWNMGAKITVDSATLMNKGLEIMEAHWLFDLPFDKIDVVIHPQSIVHSFVEFIDGSILAQMGDPDMRFPILYALSYPARCRSSLRSRITKFPELTFEEVDADRYPCFGLAREAARRGGNAPTVLNAANEIAVGAFLKRKLAFEAIPSVVERALAAIPPGPITTIEDIFTTDRETRDWLAAEYSFDRSEVS
jgi:1-deoxy-D-xylulose-5-phosphate reductoisomerase